MDTTTGVELTQESFKKAAQRLHKHLSERQENSKAAGEQIKLSEVQEALAKSLSFRSFNEALGKLPGKKKKVSASVKSEGASIEPASSLFGSAGKFGQMLMEMLPDQGDTMWRGRAISLISSAAIVLDAKVSQSGNSWSSKDFEEQLWLRTLMSDVKNAELPLHAKRVLEGYLKSLPGYVEGRSLMESEVLREQHGYLQMQIHRALEWMSRIEECDVVLFSPAWTSGDVDVYKQSVREIDNIEWSWLYHPVFKELVEGRLAVGGGKELKASDLLRLQSNSFMPGKNVDLKSLLETLFARYASAMELSKKIQAAASVM